MTKSDNLPPQFKKAVEQARLTRGLGLIFGGISFLGIGGAKTKELAKQARDIAAQADELTKLPQRFQERFRAYGWLISESTSVEIAKEAIRLVDNGKADEANELLCTQFEEDHLDFLIMRMNAIPEFRPRYDLARTAARLSQAGQFTGAVPLILITLDGLASDALGKSIFSEGIDVSEVKALAGSADGFPQLIADVSKIRRKTNAEEITFPFRNGIIHGKDVNFGNRFVTAKSWSLLACLGDILRAKSVVEEVEDTQSFLEVLEDYKKTREYGERIATWAPREKVEIVGDGSIEQQAFPDGSPEDTLCRFLNYWRCKNYGKMGELTVYYDKRSIGKRAGEIRDDLTDFQLRNACLIEIRDEAAAVTKIICKLNYQVGDEQRTDEFSFRLIHMDHDVQALARDEAGGSWLVMPSYQGWALGKRFRN